MRGDNRLPFLADYVRYAVSWRQRRWNLDLSARTVAGGIATSLGVGIAVALSGHGLASILAGIACSAATFIVVMLFAFRASLRSRNAQQEPEVLHRRQAFQVAERLEKLLDARRLSRDLSFEVSTLLEESARNWQNVRTMLDSPYWNRADLRPALRSVRDQSLVAVDQGMQEMLLLLATNVPNKPGQWTFAELFEDVSGKNLFGARAKVEHLSPFYDEARYVAEKLKELADQVEEASRTMVGEALVEGAPRPGSALEVTLSELKQIKEAEAELSRDYLNG